MLGALIPLALGALSIGEKIAGASGQNAAARANKQASLLSYRQNLSAISERQAQTTEAARGDIASASSLSFIEQGLAATSAAEAGVGGNSATLIQNDLERKLMEFVTGKQVDLTQELAQLDRQKLGAAADAQSHINSVPMANGLSTALGIAGAGISAYDGYLRRKPIT